MSIQSVMPYNHLILCRPLLLPSIFPSIRVFSSESVLPIRWPKYWSFNFSISPSSVYSVLISFRIDWLDFLAIQGTLKSLLQYHSSKASILWCSAFFMVQLSHPYMTPGKTIALNMGNFVGKVMSLLFNTLSMFVIDCLCLGFPGGSEVKIFCFQCGRPGFDPWVGKIPWRRKWQPTPVFLPGESHGWSSLVDPSPWCRKESDMTERLHYLFTVFVMAFLPRNKCLLISWLQSPSEVILEPKKVVYHCFHFVPHLFTMK